MNLKKLITTGVLILGLASSAATAVTINWDNNYRIGSGGEFTLVDTGLDLGAYDATATTGTSGIIGSDSFQTFCIEYNEYISQGQTVSFGLSSAATLGGVNVPGNPGGNPDPVSIGTAFLYSQFAAGSLTGYDYTLAGRQTSAGLLQNAIWFLEGERTAADIGANIFVDAVELEFTTLANAVLDAGGAYNVKAVNLELLNGTRRQDQLYVAVPDGGTTLALLGLAMSSLAFIARRRRA